MKTKIAICAGLVLVLAASVALTLGLHRDNQRQMLDLFQRHQLLVARDAVGQVEAALGGLSRQLQGLCPSIALLLSRPESLSVELERQFQSLKGLHVAQISIADATGAVIAWAGDLPAGGRIVDQSLLEWARQPENEERIYAAFLPVTAQTRLREPNLRLVLAKRVCNRWNATGQQAAGHGFTGIISLSINFGDLVGEQLSRMGHGLIGRSWVLAEDGTLLYHAEHPEMELRNVARAGRDCLGCHPSMDHVSRILDSKQGTIDFTVIGFPKMLAAFTPLRIADRSWILVVNSPYDIVTAASSQNLRKTLLLLGITVTALIAGSALVYRGHDLRVKAEAESRRWQEKRALEDIVRQSEERYRTIVETTRDIIWTLDTRGNFTFANSSGEAISGYPVHEILGQPFTPLVHPDDLPKAREVMQENLAGRSSTYEMRFRAKSGETFVLSASSVPLFAGSEVTGIVSVARDITAQKRAEAELRDSQQKYETLVNSLDGIVWEADRDTFRYSFVGKPAERILGYPLSRWLAEPTFWEDHLHPDDREAAVSGRSQAVGRDYVLEYRMLSADGHGVWFRDVARIDQTEGASGRLRGIMVDVSERKRAEEQLRQSQKMEAIGQLAGGIAHDFNNLVTVITGYSDLALATMNEGDPLRAAVQEIGRAGERAASVTRQLLAFARRQILQPRVLDLNAVVEQTDRMLRRLIGEDIELVADLDPDLGRVKADVGQIEQVLLNLAVNARDAMEGGGRLILKTRNVTAPDLYAHSPVDAPGGDCIALDVIDTGCGMDEETLSHIFEPFFTTKEAGKGTGLGLSTVYGIIRQSGGSISVSSRPGEGSQFHILLPRVEDEIQPEAQATDHDVEDDLCGSETILLVEDEEAVRDLARRILESKGYKVIPARNGNEALSICEQSPDVIHLLLTDLVMPRMNGVALAEAIRIRRPSTRILYMSVYSDDNIIRQGITARTSSFIQKPFPPDLLLRMVRASLASG